MNRTALDRQENTNPFYAGIVLDQYKGQVILKNINGKFINFYFLMDQCQNFPLGNLQLW